jgi:flagellar biosynthetic protein FlhB
MSESTGDRTEAPTPRRLQRAREEGNVPISREVAGLAGLGAGILVLSMTLGSSGRQLAGVLRNLIAASARLDIEHGGALLAHALTGPVEAFLLPIMAASMTATIAATLLQSGFVLHTKALVPDLSRLSPARGLKRVFGPTNLVETIKSLVKLAAFALVVRQILAANINGLARSGAWPIGLTGQRLSHLLLTSVLMLLAVQLVVAGLDVAWVRVNRSRGLRMSRQDLRDEQKESDGNPQVKGRLRALRRARARQRMMQAVPTAAVVLTNPTHYAVALSYEQGSKQAPKVVAKGADEVAARIRALAREHRIPLVANPPLTRILFQVPLDQEVPREQFQAVAAVIAYIWRLNQKQRPAVR